MSNQLVTLGRFGRLHGTQGRLVLHSYSDPPEAIFTYQPPLLYGQDAQHTLPVRLSEYAAIKGGFVVQVAGKDTPEQAGPLVNRYIYLERKRLPVGGDGYYWHDLIGMQVCFAGNAGHPPCNYGQVEGFIPAGEHDVMRVGTGPSQRLIPFVTPEYIAKVDFAAHTIYVHWPPDYA